MGQNDNAVVTAAVGYVFVGNVGTPRPTPAELKAADPLTYGALVRTLKSTGTPTSYTLTVGGDTTTSLPAASGPGAVQAALEALDSIGVGNVLVSGDDILDTDGLDVTFVGALQGEVVTISGTPTGGSTPAINVTTKVAVNGWKPIGHTSRGDMPEFGFEGGDAEVKGTWQNPKLREVVSEAAADYLILFLQQFDKDSLELYYGPNASAVEGVFGVSGETNIVNEKAFLVFIVDGDATIGFWSAKASVRRDAAIEMPIDDFLSLPIRATFLKLGSYNLFEWINEDLF